jgi:hypothetical protein
VRIPGVTIPAVTIGCALVFMAFYVVLGTQVADGARRNDFLNLYTGATMASEGRWTDLHTAERQHEIERRYRDVTPVRPFVRPAFYAAILSPIAAIPFEIAFYVWTTIWWVLLLAFGWWAARSFHPDAIILVALFLPTGLGIAHGQDCVLMLIFMTVSFMLFNRHPFASGAALGLLVAKFHLVLLFPILLAIVRRWRMLGGFAVSASLCAAVSIALVGMNGAREYIHLLTRKDLELLSPGETLMLNVKGLLLNFGIDSMLPRVILCAGVIALAVIAIRRDHARLYTAGAAGGLLVIPHTYIYDSAFLLPGLLACVYGGTSKTMRLFAGIFCTPLPFLLNLLGPPLGAIGPIVLLGLMIALAIAPKQTIEATSAPSMPETVHPAERLPSTI